MRPTTQIPDYITLNDKEYRIIGIKGNGLLSMKDFGVSPAARNPNCWRGFFMDYAVVGQNLLAMRLTVMGDVQDYVGLIPPQPLPNCDGCATQWDSLQRPAPYTGNLLIGRRVLRKLFAAHGFQQPAAFRDVLELEFENGILQDISDVSGQMILYRNKIDHATLAQDQPKTFQEKWKQYKYSLKYDAWWLN